MADPDLQIRGGGSQLDPEIRVGGPASKTFFGPHFGLKIRGEARAPLAPPLDPPLEHQSRFCELLLQLSQKYHFIPYLSQCFLWGSVLPAFCPPCIHVISLPPRLPFDVLYKLKQRTVTNIFTTSYHNITHRLRRQSQPFWAGCRKLQCRKLCLLCYCVKCGLLGDGTYVHSLNFKYGHFTFWGEGHVPVNI